MQLRMALLAVLLLTGMVIAQRIIIEPMTPSDFTVDVRGQAVAFDVTDVQPSNREAEYNIGKREHTYFVNITINGESKELPIVVRDGEEYPVVLQSFIDTLESYDPDVSFDTQIERRNVDYEITVIR